MLLVMGCMLLGNAAALMAAPQLLADTVKAGYIYQFSQFVTWPELPDKPRNSFDICIMGKGAISDELDPLDGKNESGRLISIIYPQTRQDVFGCNILYIAEAEGHQVQAVLGYLRSRPVLTVSSLPGFAESGGIIGFVSSNGKIRFEINREAALRSNIQLSAKLLEVASKVFHGYPEEERP